MAQLEQLSVHRGASHAIYGRDACLILGNRRAEEEVGRPTHSRRSPRAWASASMLALCLTLDWLLRRSLVGHRRPLAGFPPAPRRWQLQGSISPRRTVWLFLRAPTAGSVGCAAGSRIHSGLEPGWRGALRCRSTPSSLQPQHPRWGTLVWYYHPTLVTFPQYCYAPCAERWPLLASRGLLRSALVVSQA